MFDLVIDTETAPMRKVPMHLMAANSLVYDMGGVVRDTKTGEIVHSFSFIIADTFYNNTMMQSAYYANKLPQYHEGVAKGLWTSVSFKYAYDYIHNIIAQYGIKTVWAYNAQFDMATLNNTINHYSNGWVTDFFPSHVTVKDVWTRCANITGTKKYVSYCIDNGYLTTNGNPKTSAEIVYRYLTQNHNFIEAHTALNDAEIEAFILTCAQKNKKKAMKGIGRGYKMAADMAKSMAYTSTTEKKSTKKPAKSKGKLFYNMETRQWDYR